MRRAARVIAAVCALFVSGYGMVRWVYQPYRCNVETTGVRQRTEVAERASIDYHTATIARENARRMRLVIDQCPLHINAYMLLAANEILVGDREAAVSTYRRALTVEQRPEIHAALGDVLIELGRFDEAVASYVHAARFNPEIIAAIPSGPAANETRKRIAALRARAPAARR